MPTSRGIGVREFINQNDCRPSCENGVEVQFVDNNTLILDTPSWKHLQPF